MAPHNRPSSSRLSTATTPAHVKSRQFSHLNSQLAQLQAHLADLDNHVRITAIQAEAIKRLGAQHASMYVLLSSLLILDLWLLLALLVIPATEMNYSDRSRNEWVNHVVDIKGLKRYL